MRVHTDTFYHAIHVAMFTNLHLLAPTNRLKKQNANLITQIVKPQKMNEINVYFSMQTRLYLNFF